MRTHDRGRIGRFVDLLTGARDAAAERNERVVHPYYDDRSHADDTCLGTRPDDGTPIPSFLGRAPSPPPRGPQEIEWEINNLLTAHGYATTHRIAPAGDHRAGVRLAIERSLGWFGRWRSRKGDGDGTDDHYAVPRLVVDTRWRPPSFLDQDLDEGSKSGIAGNAWGYGRERSSLVGGFPPPSPFRDGRLARVGVGELDAAGRSPLGDAPLFGVPVASQLLKDADALIAAANTLSKSIAMAAAEREELTAKVTALEQKASAMETERVDLMARLKAIEDAVKGS